MHLADIVSHDEPLQPLQDCIKAHNAVHAVRLQAAKDNGFDAPVQEVAQEPEGVWQVALEAARQTCDQTRF